MSQGTHAKISEAEAGDVFQVSREEKMDSRRVVDLKNAIAVVPLPTHFTQGDYRYTQMFRRGIWAIYLQAHRKSKGKINRYEVIKVQIYPEHTWPAGNTTPAHEAYPGSQSWGTYGYTCFSLPEAEALFESVSRRNEDAEASPTQPEEAAHAD